MKVIAIASVGEETKVAYNAAGERFFVPTALRETVKPGGFAIVADKTFTSRTDENGDVVPCEPWTRTDITFFNADKTVVIRTKAESALLEVEEAAIVAAERVKIAKTYQLDDKLMKELEEAL